MEGIKTHLMRTQHGEYEKKCCLTYEYLGNNLARCKICDTLLCIDTRPARELSPPRFIDAGKGMLWTR